MLNETIIQAVGTGYKDEGDLRVEECNGRKKTNGESERWCHDSCCC